ncbi:UNVERIFIED_CONTAM: hypothetical protein FKN15_053225 [Acipenser sinensis]
MNVSTETLLVFADKAAENDASGMEIQCPNCSSGCTWTGLLRDYLSSHEKECECAVEPCTNATFGCVFNGERRALQHHESHTCDWRLVYCQHCSCSLPHSLLESSHERECECAVEPCTNAAFGCEFNGERRALQHHESHTCDWRLVYCQHCSCSLPHSLLEDHLSTCPKNKPRNTAEILPRGTGAEQEPQQGDNSSCQSERHSSPKKPQSLLDDLCSPAHLLRLLSVISSLQTRLDRGEEVNVAFKKLVMSKLLAMQSLLSTEQGERERDTQTPREEIATLSQDLAVCRGCLAELQSRCLGYERALQHLQSRGGATASENGTLVWKIKGFSSSLRDSEHSTALSLHSPAFLSHPFGYRLCLRLYPRGDGVGRGSHASLFLCLMRGEWDDVLPWPFRHRVTFSCLDASGGGSDVREAFIPDPLSASFQKPRAAVNVASGCPLFIRHSLLLAPHNPYLRNDTLYIKAVIETH